MASKKTIHWLSNSDAAGGVLLIVASLVAVTLANTELSGIYREILRLPVVVKIGLFEISKPLFLWVNDGLMAIFFLTVGLEVKREILQGQLSRPDQIFLPAIAALAGVVVPALIFVAVNRHDPHGIHGWAIPSATDIAFAIGIFSLFGRSLPVSLKLFLLAVAIFDDIIAIFIIALFYSERLSGFSLSIAVLGVTILFSLNRCRVRKISFYILTGIVVWAAVLKTGIHATIAGFLLAWFIPLKLHNQYNRPMLPSLENNLNPWVAFFILPMFAFVNAGVDLRSLGWEGLMAPITAGIFLGLFVGKQLGIMSVCWLCIKTGLARMPAHASWSQLYGVTVLAGIGFTMSLFIGSLAFEGDTGSIEDKVKLGVLTGSILSAVLGGIVIRYSGNKADA